jgi:outer membrane biosynthesis protein TonB
LEVTFCPIVLALADGENDRGVRVPLRMKAGRQFAVVAVVAGLLLSTACKKKTHPIAINRQAPTLAVPVPEEIPEEPLPAEPEAPSQEPATEQPPAKKPPAKHRPKKPAQPPATTQNNATVATNHPPANPAEAPTDTAIAADVTSQQVVQQRQMTKELLDSTQKDLDGLNHNLSHDEEIIVTQIKSYVEQSHKATTDRDFERAYNLAVKAHLLADALVKK